MAASWKNRHRQDFYKQKQEWGVCRKKEVMAGTQKRRENCRPSMPGKGDETFPWAKKVAKSSSEGTHI